MMKVAVPQRFKLRVVPDVKTLIFGSGREVHYIGGTEVLPPPLEGMRESEMINRLGTEYAEDAKKVLIEHNLRLVVYIAKKFDNTGVGVEDLISIGTIGLIKAINTFNPTKKIKLATYASRCIELSAEIHEALRRRPFFNPFKNRNLKSFIFFRITPAENLVVKIRFNIRLDVNQDFRLAVLVE